MQNMSYKGPEIENEPKHSLSIGAVCLIFVGVLTVLVVLNSLISNATKLGNDEADEAITYAFGILYVDENSDEIAERYTADLQEGQLYHIVSPVIENYSTTRTVIEGTMTAQDTLIIVRYFPTPTTVPPQKDPATQPSNPTNSPMDPPQDPSLEAGVKDPTAEGGATTTDTKSPTVDEVHTGLKAQKGLILQQAADAEKVESGANVIEEYLLTVAYIYDDGKAVSPSFTQLYQVGQIYSITSPAVQGYTPNISTVTGVMGAADMTITVIYTANRPF